MMQEIETLAITIGGKNVAKLIMLYGQSGWVAQVVYNFKSSQSEVVGRGTELLGPDSARQIGLDLANKWREKEIRFKRG